MEFNFKDWINIFQQNAEQYNPPDWEQVEPLISEEMKTISDSIRQFQVGESSEGKHLLDAARQYLQKHSDKSYLDAVILFIKEEQRHATTLRIFMERVGISTIRKHWVDRIFRSLRRLAGLELSIVVLLTAELIAMVYYQALHRSTQSQVLKQICEQILADEEQHIAFQSATLHKCWHDRSRFSKVIWKIIRRSLIALTILVVWFQHRSVLKAGGYTSRSFYRAVIDEYHKSSDLIATGVSLK